MATTDNTLQLAQRHKRRRTESRATNPSSQNPDNEFCRDDRIWFEDGNIIVRAGPGCTGQGKIYGFKCHKSVLAIRSAVFETMFQLPNESGDTFDGIPTVDFPDDPADVGALLSALYGLLVIPEERRQSGLLVPLSGALRLAIKYEVKDVSLRITSAFERDWPESYDSWALVQRELKGKLRTIPKDEHYDINLHIPNPIPMLRLSHELRLTSVRRAVYYEICCSRFSTVNPDKKEGLHDRVLVNPTQLSPDDLVRILSAREWLEIVVDLLVFKEIPPCLDQGLEANCSTPDEDCAEELKEWWKGAEGRRMLPLMHSDPLLRLMELEDELREVTSHISWQACTECRTAFANLLLDRSRRLWDMLPKIFKFEDLPS